MKRLLTVVFGILICLLLVTPRAKATVFNFEGTALEGIGSATMDFVVSGNTLTATLENTSPTYLNNSAPGDLDNAPGISMFGFNVSNSDSLTYDWNLTAYLSDRTGPMTIGSSSPTTALESSWDLIQDHRIGNIMLDYMADNDPQTDKMDEALFNWDAYGSSALPGGQNTVFYTTAVLTMQFSAEPLLDTTGDWSPFVRMKNVGRNGDGSLKLAGEEGGSSGDEPNPIPEPATMLLLGGGLAGLAATRKKHKK